MAQLTKQDYQLIATLEHHAGFVRLMEWQEDIEREQSKLLLNVDAFKDPEEVTKLQASILEKQVFRKMLRDAISRASSPEIDLKAQEKKEEHKVMDFIRSLVAN